MPITQEAIATALSRVIEPDLKKDIVELDLVREVVIDEHNVHVTVEVSNPAMHSRKRMEEAVTFQLKPMCASAHCSPMGGGSRLRLHECPSQKRAVRSSR